MSYPVIGAKFRRRYYHQTIASCTTTAIAYSVPIYARGQLAHVLAATGGTLASTGVTFAFSKSGAAVTGLSTATVASTGTLGTNIFAIDMTASVFVNNGDSLDTSITAAATSTAGAIPIGIVWAVNEF